MTSAIQRITAELNISLSPKLADKHALTKINPTSMEVSMFQLVFNLGIIFEMNDKTTIELGFHA